MHRGENGPGPGQPHAGNAGRPILGNTPRSDIDISHSKLSVNAPEFVPRAFKPQQAPPIQPPQRQMPPPMQHPNQYRPPRAEGEKIYGFDPSVRPQEQLRQCISLVMRSPGSLDDILRPLAESLYASIPNEGTLIAIVEELFQQSVQEANFRYSGARICNYFSHHLHTQFANGNFKTHLLNRCYQEHHRRLELASNSSTRPHLIGFTLFMGELLLNMREENQQHIKILAVSIQDLVKTLLDYPEDTCLKCVVQVLKLTGAILEDLERSDPQGQSRRLNEMFAKVKETIVDERINRNIKAMLLSVVELRAKDWGRKEAERSMNGSAQGDMLQPQEPGLFYGDPQMQYDESQYMQPQDYMNAGDVYWANAEEEFYDCYYDAEFDDEIADAFEQFIQENQQGHYGGWRH